MTLDILCINYWRRLLLGYLSDSKTYDGNSGLVFWINSEHKYPLLAPIAQDLLAAPASEAYVERVFSVCGDLTSGKRNRLDKGLEKRAFLKMNSNCPAMNPD